MIPGIPNTKIKKKINVLSSLATSSGSHTLGGKELALKKKKFA